jgi:short-subunit dehydrogenase
MNSEGTRYALITGASAGIGEAFARLLAAEGRPLILVARTESELNRVAGVLATQHDVPITVVALDLGRPDAVGFLARELERRGLQPDVIINNAGFGLFGAAHELSAEEQVAMVDINVRALTDLTLRFLPGMVARGRGGVLNVSSIAGFAPGPYMAVYHASKAFALSFSEALSAELAGTGVTVSAFCPGPVLTGFHARAGIVMGRRTHVLRSRTAEEVVENAWRAFERGQRVITTDPLAAGAAWFARVMPRSLVMGATRRIFLRSRK